MQPLYQHHTTIHLTCYVLPLLRRLTLCARCAFGGVRISHHAKRKETKICSKSNHTYAISLLAAIFMDHEHSDNKETIKKDAFAKHAGCKGHLKVHTSHTTQIPLPTDTRMKIANHVVRMACSLDQCGVLENKMNIKTKFEILTILIYF